MSNSSLADFNGPNSRVRQRLIRQPPASDPGGSPPDQHTPRRWGLLMATSGDFHKATDSWSASPRIHLIGLIGCRHVRPRSADGSRWSWLAFLADVATALAATWSTPSQHRSARDGVQGPSSATRAWTARLFTARG